MTEARTRMPSRAADFRTTSAFAARLDPEIDRFVVWTVPWPLGSAAVDPGRPRPSSLYTFRRQNRRLGSALSEHDVPESSPNLSASRPVFPSGRLTYKSAVSAYSTIIPVTSGLFDGRVERLPRRNARLCCLVCR